jgi:acyl-CoA reductase-like NAD-dependent aldehyde dehydrogenase
MERRELLIADAPPEQRGVLEVRAPWDGAVLAQVETAGPAHVERALDVAYQLYRHRSTWLPVHERLAILAQLETLMREQAESLALQAAGEGGKPLADSRVEVARAIDGVRICADVLRTEEGEVVPMGATAAGAGRVAFTFHEPVGVVVAVSAFNHPLNLIVHQVCAAVAAGCPVIVKPAGDTPLSCHSLVSLLHQAGLPEAWAQCAVTESNELAEALVTDPRVGFFSFIGSARVGWMLRSRLAPGTRCALEHGGAAPLIVAEDADLAVAVPAILKGGFYHAGQVCVSVQRVYVHASLAQELASRLATGADALRIGDPTLADTEVGPLIREREVDRVSRWVTEAVAGGAVLRAGGQRLSASTHACTVLESPPADARVSTEEVFGPVVCVYPFDELGEAYAQANALPLAFQSAVFTRSVDVALSAARHLDASAVMVNDHTAFRVDGMPFAGLRESGLGVGGITHTMRDMRVNKMVVIRSPAL